MSGIWNHVRLRSTGAAVLGDPRVETTLPGLPDTGTAEITLTVPVRNVESTSRSITVQAAFDDVKVSTTVTVEAGKSTDVTFAPAQYPQHPQLRVRDPKLWWPNGYGDPDLHDLTITATAGGKQSDRRTVRFGIRQFDYGYDSPITIDPATDSARQTVDFAAQKSRYVRIQCGRRATGWGDSRWSLSVIDAAHPTRTWRCTRPPRPRRWTIPRTVRATPSTETPAPSVSERTTCGCCPARRATSPCPGRARGRRRSRSRDTTWRRRRAELTRGSARVLRPAPVGSQALVGQPVQRAGRFGPRARAGS